MQRITQENLCGLLKRINAQAGFDNPKYSTVGSYALDWAYSGVKLVQYVNEQGGERNITSGYVPKRELWNSMHAYLNGMQSVNKEVTSGR